QHDMTQGYALGHEVDQYRAETGHKSLWTNAVFGGMPTYQTSPYYASTRMFSWIGKVYGLFLPQPANLLAMMMIGMFILLLAMKVKPWMSLIGAVAWGLSSYFVIIIGAGHLWKFYALTYVPPTIAGLVLIYNGRRLLGAAVAALFMALQIAANHVQMSYYFAFVMAAMVIAYGVSALRQKKLGRWGVNTAILAGAMVLAVAANAPTLYHTYEYSKLSTRGGHSELTPEQVDAANATSGLDRDYITTYSYGRGETLSLLIPNVVGGSSAMPRGGHVVGLTLADTPEGRELMVRDRQMTLLQLFSPYFGGAEGTNGPVYVGAIIVMLFIFGAIVVKGPMKWALVIMTVLSILLALGRNLQWFTDLFIDYMPLYSRFRAVESILVIAEFTMPLLAILGLREFFNSADRKTLVRPLAISAGISVGLCLIVMMMPSIVGSTILGERDVQTIGQYISAGALPGDFNIAMYPAVLQAVESMRVGAVRADALRSLAFLCAGCLPLFFMARGSLKPAAALAIVGIAVGLDLFTADKRYLNSDSFTAAQPTQQLIAMTPADRAILADTTQNYRVLDAT
ncbi:MAG: YfhO family protein, partial [Muribaculaceae bacterium]|nr:YfhO family protein [Muribaculaceae bacterium]